MDPQTLTFQATALAPVVRTPAAMAVMGNGQVLVVGGCSEGMCWGVLASAEIFDPVTESWTRVPPLSVAADSLTATTLEDGRVLVAGGIPGPNCATANVEIFDPWTRTWSAGPRLSFPRFGHTATLLPGGDVLIVGGELSNYEAVGAVERLSVQNNSSTVVAHLAVPRMYHAAAPLGGGRVIVVGGMRDWIEGSTATTEIWPP